MQKLGFIMKTADKLKLRDIPQSVNFFKYQGYESQGMSEECSRLENTRKKMTTGATCDPGLNPLQQRSY